MTINAGAIIDEKFEVLDTLGQGAFGQVYLARHILINRTVALKLLTAAANDVDAQMRFEREARILSALEHPYIAHILCCGVWRGYSYTALEFIRGETLQQVVSRDGALPQSVAFVVTAQILEALSAAHEVGVVHRDLKPSNIMMSPRGVKLIDFGLAYVMNPEENQRLTQDGMAIGNALYMPPEQCLGKVVDHRADLYAVGCLLYFMLTGEHPFIADTGVAVMFKHMNEPMPLLNSEPLDALLAQFCAKDPAARIGSADEALELIRNFNPKDKVIAPVPKANVHFGRTGIIKVGCGVAAFLLLLLFGHAWYAAYSFEQQVNALMLHDKVDEVIALAKIRNKTWPGCGVQPLKVMVYDKKYLPIMRATLVHKMNYLSEEMLPLREKVELLREARDLTAISNHAAAHFVALALYAEGLKKLGPQNYAEAKATFAQALRELNARAIKDGDPGAYDDIRTCIKLWWKEAATAAHDDATVAELDRAD